METWIHSRGQVTLSDELAIPGPALFRSETPEPVAALTDLDKRLIRSIPVSSASVLRRLHGGLVLPAYGRCIRETAALPSPTEAPVVSYLQDSARVEMVTPAGL